MAESESGLPSLDRDTPTLMPGEFKTIDSVDSDLKLELTENLSPGTSENKSMDQFLQRKRTDLMYELRNIRHGERPVTGQSHRENIQHFMEKHVVGREGGFKGFDKERNVPANVDSVEKHRPEAVIIEVQGVVDLRPVTSVLQSAAFRRHLENVIRGSFSGRQSVRSVSVNHSSTFNLSPFVTTNSTETTNPTPVIASTAERQPAEARPQLARQDSSESVCSFSSARSSHEQDIDSDNEEEEEMVLAPEPVAPRYQESAAAAADSQGQERGISDQREPPPVSFSWNDISSIQRNEIVEEISELLHGRLVSSTLEGEFRTVLELVAENHLVSTGTNGRAVQDFIHALPRTGVQRNDFSHLGIAPAHENDNWDNVSVTSVSAHSIPYAQTNTYLGREIQSLHSQMNEMKNMLKMSLDLQMDIQRAIRQEVAAAMNSYTAEGATGVTSMSPKNTGPINDTHCLICLERHTDTVLYQCGHMCVCFICGRDLVSRGHKCPVCRAPIKDVIRTYRTNAD